VEEGWTSSSSQAAELKAEKLRSYKEMRYINAAAAQGISQPRAEDNAAKQAAQGGDAVKAAGPEPRAEDVAVQHRGEDEIARHAEDASVVPDQKQPSDGLGRIAEVSSPSQPEENSAFSKPGALTPQPSVADQAPPLAPPDRGKKAAPAAPSGARDAQALAVAQAPQFDTPETLSQQIIAALSARKEYPLAALRRKTEGVVKLSLVVAPNGSLIKASIQSPSGSSVLDEAALRLVQGIFPLKVTLASAVSLVVPVEYRIPK
jgi:TonB family protein